MNNSRLKGTAFLTIATGVFMICGYLINVLLGRLLGSTNYGVYGIIIAIISFVNIVQTSGVTQGVSKHLSESKEDTDAILKSGLILQGLLNTIFFIIFFFFANFISLLLQDRELEPYIKLSAFIFPMYGFYALYLDYYNGLHLFKTQALLNISYSLSKLFFVLTLGFFYNLYGVFIGFILAPILSILIGIRFPKKNKRVFPIKKLFIFSLPLIGVAIFSNLLLSIDIFFVKTLLHSKESTGYYTASQTISRLIFYSMSAFFLVIFPSVSHAVSNNLHEKARKIIESSLRIIFIIITPLVALVSATSSELIEIIYSSRYMESSSSLSILVFGIGSFTLFTAFTYILSAAGRPYIASVFSFIGLIISIILCILLIPLYGLNGAAIATTIGSTSALIIAGKFVSNYFRLHISVISIFRVLSISIILYFLLSIISFNYFLLPFVYIIFFVLYFILLVLTKGITRDDYLLVSSLVPKWL